MSRSTELTAEFLETLTALATGSYLRPEEQEFWEPPYPPEVTADAAEILRRLTAEVRQDPTEISLAVIAAFGALTALSDRHGGAVFEDDEEEDFRTLVSALAEEYGQDADAVLADLDRITDQED
ncbi:hypothetical protein [Corynebacterium terpenotabidum]|uniref:Uncharacterized protein n=1 Tax=Corynebacterium terpenotabidum Y-11 TaxID=1200352 RepID=S4XJL6_9CORY|nr:hypothetical protein [Corynebacterium terpenotabidum]AGP30768.1 hypothetical protein A606_05605 [Corynebacterium terpenotabidum Y-11]